MGERLRSSYAVHIGHTNIHNHQVRSYLARQVNGAYTITCLSYDQVALFREDIFQIHALDSFVVCDNNTCRHSALRYIQNPAMCLLMSGQTGLNSQDRYSHNTGYRKYTIRIEHQLFILSFAALKIALLLSVLLIEIIIASLHTLFHCWRWSLRILRP